MNFPKKLALPALAFLIASPILLTNDAFSHGDSPSACENRYDAEITSMSLDNGTQTFDPVSDSDLQFDAQVEEGYDVTFTLHTANASSANNTLSGTTWYRLSAYGFGSGVCVDGAGPDEDVSVTLHVDAPSGIPDGYQQNNVEWGSWPKVLQLAYDVTWRSSEPEEQPQNETASPPPKPPADNEVEDSEPEEEEESNEEESGDSDPEGTVHSPFVFRERETGVATQTSDTAQEPLPESSDALYINGTLLSYHALNEIGVPQLHVLSGNWSMAMNDTAVTGFHANFTMAPLGGGMGEQAFSLGNLTAVNMRDMALENGTLSMNGTLDYSASGQATRINATITVQNLTSVTIGLEGELEKPIHGAVDKVTRIKDGQVQVMARQFDMI